MPVIQSSGVPYFGSLPLLSWIILCNPNLFKYFRIGKETEFETLQLKGEIAENVIKNIETFEMDKYYKLFPD
jgi:hypothetical protein